MVYGVMQRHEGTVAVESELGKGTTFRLVFPVRKLKLPNFDTNMIRPPVNPLRVLCIDDEPLVRDLLQEMLEREGHEVEVRDGGQSGVDAYREAHTRGQPFDVVITDLGMPYVDGRQVAAILKREFPTAPIVMLTGWGAFMKEDGSAPVQVDSVLSKPPRSRELSETLSRLTAKNEKAALVSQRG
jgi:CheY-like chemotaxis protein